MIYTVSITSQGQISIPAEVRRKLNLGKKKKATVSVVAGKLIVEPIVDLLDLKGSLKTNKPPLTNDQLEDIVAQAVVDEFEKSNS